MIQREAHPVADLFPLMPDPELEALSRDIETNGLREPIWLHPDGRIIDGRNRYRACMLVGVEPETRVWEEGGDLVAFVVSLNLHRRHLSESQRAMVAAKIANLAHGTNQHTTGPENLPVHPVTQAAAAELLSVSDRSVRSGRAVHDHGVPELVQAVESGAVPVSAAAEVARIHSPDVQRAILAGGAKAVTEEAAKIRNDRVPARRAYTHRMQELVTAAINASDAGQDEIDGIPTNDLMVRGIQNAIDLLSRIVDNHNSKRRNHVSA